MQQGFRTRVGGTTGGPYVHAVQQRTLRHRQRHRLRTTNSLASVESREQEEDAQIQACTVSCCDSRGVSEAAASNSNPSQQQWSQINSKAWVLPMVAAHQLLTAVHMQAHAAETVPPAAFALFREFLVGAMHWSSLVACATLLRDSDISAANARAAADASICHSSVLPQVFLASSAVCTTCEHAQLLTDRRCALVLFAQQHQLVAQPCNLVMSCRTK
eukprot:GHUV01022900.1.p1 GENE.GHUV01022900.1~~GHUV01022900.1.p1  ORF type:complete len:217 (-),score=56.76 GHUV01022900.1:2038-2688(-)